MKRGRMLLGPGVHEAGLCGCIAGSALIGCCGEAKDEGGRPLREEVLCVRQEAGIVACAVRKSATWCGA